MGDYDAQLDNETYDLDSLAWLAHPEENRTWHERGWYTAVNCVGDEIETTSEEMDQFIDFACAVLHDIWEM